MLNGYIKKKKLNIQTNDVTSANKIFTFSNVTSINKRFTFSKLYSRQSEYFIYKNIMNLLKI